MSAFGQTQLPPTAWMNGAAMNSPMFCVLTPPVGMNLIPPNGPESAFMAESPPYTPAGKNFTTFSPSFMAAMISVGVTQPGVTATPFSTHQRTTSSSKPGATMNFAPHSTALRHWASVMTVPAPTSISGQLSATALIESAAAAVRNVISITSTPPASKAFAVVTASFASSSTTTGTTADAASLFKLSIFSSLLHSQNART